MTFSPPTTAKSAWCHSVHMTYSPDDKSPNMELKDLEFDYNATRKAWQGCKGQGAGMNCNWNHGNPRDWCLVARYEALSQGIPP